MPKSFARTFGQDLMRGEHVVGGVVEKQKSLFQKQTDGFDRDAEQKAAKLYNDWLAILATVGGATAIETVATDAGYTNAEIKIIMDKVRAGIDVAPAA